MGEGAGHESAGRESARVPKVAEEDAMNVGVVGAGIFGLSTALELARRGHAVTVYDRSLPPVADGASNDHSKALRFEYGAACPLYVPLVAESRDRYRSLEREARQSLYVETGVLGLAASFDDESSHEFLSHNYLVEHDWPVQLWTPEEARARFPQFSYQGISAVTWNPEGGYVRAADAVRATAAAAIEAGAVIGAPARVRAVEPVGRGAARVVLESGEARSFDAAVVAIGAWWKTLFGEALARVRPTRQFVTYYRPSGADAARFTPPAFPVWMHDLRESGWYGMPLEGGLVKVARHAPGALADPDAPREVRDADRAESRAFVAKHLPAIDPKSYAEDRGCLYALTEDGNFLLDRLPGEPRVVVAGGGSGHGFKLGPAVGRLAADLVEGEEPVSAFRFDAVRDGRVA
jgi:glycine/D-amino acid oxidase-like deaminating enzyme